MCSLRSTTWFVWRDSFAAFLPSSDRLHELLILFFKYGLTGPDKSVADVINWSFPCGLYIHFVYCIVLSLMNNCFWHFYFFIFYHLFRINWGLHEEVCKSLWASSQSVFVCLFLSHCLCLSGSLCVCVRVCVCMCLSFFLFLSLTLSLSLCLSLCLLLQNGSDSPAVL